jgi:hypothetical protein
MFEAMVQLTEMSGRLNEVRNVSSRLVRADSAGNAKDLVQALQELQKTFVAIEFVLVRYLSLDPKDSNRDASERELVKLECGASEGGAAMLVGEMRARCTKIGFLYRDSLRDWFGKSPISSSDKDNLEELFMFISESDNNVIIPAVDELVGWLCDEISKTLDSVHVEQYKQARDRVLQARRDVTSLRWKMGNLTSDLRDLELQFTG